MRRTFALIVAAAVALMAAPAAGANPKAVQWTETDVMGAPTGVIERTAGDWIHEQFSRAGTFTAEAGDFTYAGTVEWDAAGKVRLDEAGVFPVFGTFRGKGTYVFDAGDGPMAGTTCRLTFQSKLVEDSTGVFPPFVFYGNQVAHCDNGSKIHGRIFGPTGPGSDPPLSFHQTVTGTLK
jgi:hypothetical protein